MKINWEVNIDEKKVSSKDIDFSFEFDIEFSFNSWHLVAKEINYKNEKELIEALVNVLIFGNRNFLKWSDVYEKIKN